VNTSSGTELNGHKTQRLANTSNITFHGVESEALLILLDKEGICASSGSACLADSDEPAHEVLARDLGRHGYQFVWLASLQRHKR
jgi:cysteine desulfurase